VPDNQHGLDVQFTDSGILMLSRGIPMSVLTRLDIGNGTDRPDPRSAGRDDEVFDDPGTVAWRDLPSPTSDDQPVDLGGDPALGG
jgi:hypothetical protein